MGQLGFFDLNRRYESLTEKNDPLVAIAAMVPAPAVARGRPSRHRSPKSLRRAHEPASGRRCLRLGLSHHFRGFSLGS
jgi:hypothetical protein